MIAIRTFRYLYTRALSFLTITCKMESQKHASRFDLRYDIYSGLWCHKPMKELGFECDFVKLRTRGELSAPILGSETASAVSDERLLRRSAWEFVPWREWKIWSSYSASSPNLAT